MLHLSDPPTGACLGVAPNRYIFKGDGVSVTAPLPYPPTQGFIKVTDPQTGESVKIEKVESFIVWFAAAPVCGRIVWIEFI